MNFLLLGASPNPLRYSNKAMHTLVRQNKSLFAIGYRVGTVAGIEIQKGFPQLPQIHTILLYMGAERQKEYYSYILELHPQRVVFNPGAENEELEELLLKNNIEVILGCALVMINSGQL